jgi:hypothetical protein
MKTIYNTFIRVTSQEQCDRLKQVCIDNRLQIWDFSESFDFEGVNSEPVFTCCSDGDFAIYNDYELTGETQVTEAEWMQLLVEEKNNPTIFDIQQRINKALEYLESFKDCDQNKRLINLLRHGKIID